MKGFLDLFFPHRCISCHRIIHLQEIPLCVLCYSSLPLSHWQMDQENLTYRLLANEIHPEAASSLLVYDQQHAGKKLIMANKYYNMPQIGVSLALLSQEILHKFRYDVVTCVPSHPRTLRTRGYNQVTAFAQKTAALLNSEFRPDLLRRVKRNASQTHKNRKERIESLDSAFEVADEIVQYNSVLLLDDVLTTGATLSHCGRLIQDKKDLKLYIFTMAKVI